MSCGTRNNRAWILLVGFLLLTANVRAEEQPKQVDLWTGKALNELLRKFRDLEVPKSPEPPPLLPAKVRAAINVRTPSGIDASLFLKAKSLVWPMLLDETKEKPQVVAVLAEITRQANKDKVSAKTVKELKDALSRLSNQLTNMIEEITPSQYIESKRFLNRLEGAMKGATLAKLNAELKLAAEVTAKGTSAPDLVRMMTTNKMTFAPAFGGDLVAYEELYKAMLEYYRKASKPAK